MMRINTIIFLLVFMISAPGLSFAQGDMPWQVSVSANYGKWDTGDVDNHGAQALGYTQVAYDSEDWGVALTGSYAGTSYNTTQAQESFAVNTLTDTTLSSYYTVDSGNLKIRGGVDVGLPTGKHSFSVSELGRLITDDIDEDLMLVNSYGGGTDISPHLGVSYDMAPVTLGLGLKYVYAGEYDPTTDAQNDNYDPGDSITALVSGAVSFSNRDNLMVIVSYSTHGKDRIGGADVFRNGDEVVLEARYVRQWTDLLRGTIGLVYSTQDKNEVVNESDLLKSETGNSNSNKTEAFFDLTYELTGQLTMSGIVGYKAVAGNDYSQGDTLYDAGRTSFYAEPGVIVYFSDSMYMTAKLRYLRLADKKDAFSTADATYQVINADVGVVYSF